MKLTGKYKVTVERGGKIIGVREGMNMITDEGKNAILELLFGASTKPSLFVGLINNSPTPVVAAADTFASHAGWVEATTYDEADRQALVMGTAASKTIATSAQSVFTISGAVSIYGFFICDDDAKGNTGANFLWNTARFDSVISAIDDDVVKVDYSVSIS